MISKVTLRYFKCFGCEEFDLADHVILAGPNNSGKSTLLQAILTWNVALQRWEEKRGRARVFKLFTDNRITRYISHHAPRIAGKFWGERGQAFEKFLEEAFFPGAFRGVRTGRGSSIDFEWRGRVIEAKAGVHWGADLAKQLKSHAEYAMRKGRNLVYMFVNKPSSAATQDISNAGGTVFYLFD